MLKDLIEKLRGLFASANTEAEGEETLDHDIVMIRQDGQMVEVTTDDSEKGKQE